MTRRRSPGALRKNARLHVKDQPYFRQSREARWGTSLEKFAQPPAQSVPALRQAIAPLRATLQRQPYVAGEHPLFADYVVFGAFQFARVMSPITLLEADDPVGAWRERMLDAFGGYARQAVGHAV